MNDKSTTNTPSFSKPIQQFHPKQPSEFETLRVKTTSSKHSAYTTSKIKLS